MRYYKEVSPLYFECSWRTYSFNVPYFLTIEISSELQDIKISQHNRQEGNSIKKIKTLEFKTTESAIAFIKCMRDAANHIEEGALKYIHDSKTIKS